MAHVPAPGPVDPGPTRAERRRQRRTVRREPNRKLRRRLAIAAFACWSLGLAAVALATGHMLFNRYATHASPPIVVQTPTVGGVAATPQDVVMPDVEGLSRDRALEALADAGFDPGTVTFSEKPYAAAVGSVVSQDPLRGTRNPKTVQLATAVATSMPVVVGLTSSAASAALEALGARVRTEQVYAPGKAVGTVTESTPAAGAPLVADVTIRVSSDPSAVFLATLRSVRSDCSSTSVTVATKTYDHALRCSPGSTQDVVSYQISRLAAGLQATVTLADNSPTGTTARVVVVGDGQPVATVDVAPGQAKDVTVSLDGVLQLEFRVTGTASPSVVIGDPKVLGSADNMTRLSQARP